MSQSGKALLRKGLYPNFSKHGLPRAKAGIQDSQSNAKQSQSMGKSPFCSHLGLARTGLSPWSSSGYSLGTQALAHCAMQAQARKAITGEPSESGFIFHSWPFPAAPAPPSQVIIRRKSGLGYPEDTTSITPAAKHPTQ